MSHRTSLKITGGSITGNPTSLAAALPDSIESGADSGGIYIDSSVPTASITDSTVSDNSPR